MIYNKDTMPFFEMLIAKTDRTCLLPANENLEEVSDTTLADIIALSLDSRVFDDEGGYIPSAARFPALNLYHSAFNSMALTDPLVSVIQTSGSGRMMLDAARVSYGRDNNTSELNAALNEKDQKLLMRLFRDNHGTPAEHNLITFRLLVPNPIFKQFIRHRVGVSINEISSRYATIKDRFYIPKRILKQSEKNHQGSKKELIEDHDMIRDNMVDAMSKAYLAYNLALKNGASKEMARFILPTGFYTEAYYTMNIRSLLHFLNLRLSEHAQYEAREYAKMMGLAACFVFPDFFRVMLSAEQEEGVGLLPYARDALVNLTSFMDPQATAEFPNPQYPSEPAMVSKNSENKERFMRYAPEIIHSYIRSR